jgi:hypothetical protein
MPFKAELEWIKMAKVVCFLEHLDGLLDLHCRNTFGISFHTGKGVKAIVLMQLRTKCNQYKLQQTVEGAIKSRSMAPLEDNRP